MFVRMCHQASTCFAPRCARNRCVNGTRQLHWRLCAKDAEESGRRAARRSSNVCVMWDMSVVWCCGIREHMKKPHGLDCAIHWVLQASMKKCHFAKLPSGSLEFEHRMLCRAFQRKFAECDEQT